MNPAVGVDLGTTNTVVGIQVDSTGPRTLDIRQPVYERNLFEFRDHIKSAVYFESEDTAVVGAFASRRLDAFRSIKSRMGTRWQMPHPFREDILLTPAYISAHILKLAFSEVAKQFSEWDETAIITVPASFNTDQRSDTLRAAKLAGFKGVRLLDEPTAAFYYFFEQNRDMFKSSEEKRVLVFDFGGGTLDVSIIRVHPSGSNLVVDAVGRSRYNNLGGDDIDTDLAAFLLALWEQQEGVGVEKIPSAERKALVQLFLQKASAYKEEVEFYLAQGQPLSEFVVDETLSGSASRPIRIHKQLSRAHYEEVSGRFFLENGDLNIFRPIGQALQVAVSIVPDFSKNDIDLILYTGGASRMLGVKSALESYFAPKSCFSITDEEACNTVALGAASCRYDEMRASAGVQMTARLLESILTRDEDHGIYVPIVPLTAEPARDLTTVDSMFRLRRPAVTLKLPLFRGTGATDPNLMPMQDLVLRLPRVLPSGTQYSLSYRITENKTVQLQARFTPETGSTIAVDSELDIDQDTKKVRNTAIPLARIN